jgi:hypothetical protein
MMSIACGGERRLAAHSLVGLLGQAWVQAVRLVKVVLRSWLWSVDYVL